MCRMIGASTRNRTAGIVVVSILVGPRSPEPPGRRLSSIADAPLHVDGDISAGNRKTQRAPQWRGQRQQAESRDRRACTSGPGRIAFHSIFILIIAKSIKSIESESATAPRDLKPWIKRAVQVCVRAARVHPAVSTGGEGAKAGVRSIRQRVRLARIAGSQRRRLLCRGPPA